MPGKRHVKGKGEANPYDPQWAMDFARRSDATMAQVLAGKRRILRLGKDQKGVGPVCRQKMTEETGWNNHHSISKACGGSDKQSNRVFLHPNGHRQVHVLKETVAKPRPGKGV